MVPRRARCRQGRRSSRIEGAGCQHLHLTPPGADAADHPAQARGIKTCDEGTGKRRLERSQCLFSPPPFSSSPLLLRLASGLSPFSSSSSSNPSVLLGVTRAMQSPDTQAVPEHPTAVFASQDFSGCDRCQTTQGNTNAAFRGRHGFVSLLTFLAIPRDTGSPCGCPLSPYKSSRASFQSGAREARGPFLQKPHDF